MNLLQKEPVIRAQKSLTKFDSNLVVVELENSARTAKDAANSLNCEVGAIVKSLLLKIDNNFLLCLIAGDKRCSLNKIKKIKNSKNVRMASAEEVKEQTGYTIGGVSPVGHKNELEILIDNSLNRFKAIFAAAGHPNCIFKINYDDLKKITSGLNEDIIE
mgnify:FL=1